ncbi:MAG: SDR family oxidoreductase [Pseudomonadota bacterium]
MYKDYILIIGASSDMGGAIIRQLANENTVILAHYHKNKEKIETIAAEVSGQIVSIAADLGTETGIKALIEGVEAECYFPNKIVHLSAPKLTHIRFNKLCWQDFQYHLDIQVGAIATILGIFLPKMAKAKSGKIVFMLSSVIFGVPPLAMAHYVTAKYALLGLLKALASEYKTKQITINAVSPSMVETDFLSEIPKKLVELTAQQHPLKRNALPEDIVPLVKFLLSNESDYITGVNIPVTGGMIY